MSGPSTRQPGYQPETTVGRSIAAVREVVDQLRSPGTRRSPAPAERDDVRPGVLTVLAQRPATGSEIVRALQDRAADGRSPGAGTVYPMLQLLADEGLVTADEVDGRRTWTLTAAGRTAADDAARDRHVARAAPVAGGSERRTVARSAAQLAQTTALATQSGTPQQVGEVAAVLDDARRRIFAILGRS